LGCTLTLECDTFNAGLSLGWPAKRAIICQGTGKFSIEREHFGARGWRLYSHPFNSNIDLQQVADDIELIGSGGTSEGFYSNTYTNSAAYWYDYSKADTTISTDSAWTGFTSAKGNTISGNPNLWDKSSPLLLFNPGAVRGSGAFSNPSGATYQKGKIALTYGLDSNSVHLNDGQTQSKTITNIPSYIPTNGLVGYWPFNGNAKDESGNGNDGIVNGATLISDRNGNLNSAYSFDGLNDGIRTSDNNFPYGNSDRTITFWINNTSSGVNCAIPVRYGLHSSDNGCWILHSNSCNSSYPNGTLRADFYNSGVWSNTTMSNNQWHFISMTLNGQNCTLYLDGNNIGQGSVSINTIAYNRGFYIGADSVSVPNYFFNGVIDDIAIWNRALSNSEILTLYNASNNTNMSNKSQYYFITNPFTTPVKLSKITGLNSTNCKPYFYYWHQRRNAISGNFMPAMWQSELITNGNAARDTNISIPPFGTILVNLKNQSTTFSIPESAKQLSNFSYIIGGAKGSSSQGLMFKEIPLAKQGPGAIEVELLINDSLPVDRLLVYDKDQETRGYNGSDALKYKEQSFANIYSLSGNGKALSLDAHDITARLNSGEEQVEIPLVIDSDFNKTQKNLRLRIGEKHSELECYFKDAKTGILTAVESGGSISVELSETDASIQRYTLVFKRSIAAIKNIENSRETVSNGKSKNTLTVYPNPSDNILWIKDGKQFYSGRVEVLDITGKHLISMNLKEGASLNLEILTAGTYILKTKNENHLIKLK